MLQQQPEQCRQRLKVLPKFLQTQKKQYDRWPEKGCGWMGEEDLWRWCGVMSCHRCRFRTLAYYTGKSSRWLARNAKNKSRSMLQQQPEQCRQRLKVLPKFLQAQKKQYDRWPEKGCGWMGEEDLWRWCGVMSCHRCRFRTLAYYTGKSSRWLATNAKNKSRSMLQQQPEQCRQRLKVLPKFLQTQKKQYDRWTAKGCGWMGGEDLWRWCGVVSCHRCRFHALAYYTWKSSRWLATNAKNKSRSMFQQQPEQYR